MLCDGCSSDYDRGSRQKPQKKAISVMYENVSSTTFLDEIHPAD